MQVIQESTVLEAAAEQAVLVAMEHHQLVEQVVLEMVLLCLLLQLVLVLLVITQVVEQVVQYFLPQQ
jgi:hypothetical protein